MSNTLSAPLETKLKQIIASIRNLPTPPIVFEQIQRAINNPDTSVNDISAILSEDPAMSVKVLKLTNSAFYGLSREIDSVKHAVMIIGLEAVKNLVLSASVLNMFKTNEENKEYHENFWRHSLATAFAARVLAHRFQGGKVFNPDPAFSAGLIHDIGKMLICCFMPREHKAVREYVKSYEGISETDAEIATLGFDHSLLGRQLAINWKLPARLADAIGFHHQPKEPNLSENFAMLIGFADYVAHEAFPEGSGVRKKGEINQDIANFFHIESSEIDELKAALIGDYMKAEIFMKIAGVS